MFSPATWANQEPAKTTSAATPSISSENASATKGMDTPPGKPPTLWPIGPESMTRYSSANAVAAISAGVARDSAPRTGAHGITAATPASSRGMIATRGSRAESVSADMPVIGDHRPGATRADRPGAGTGVGRAQPTGLAAGRGQLRVGLAVLVDAGVVVASQRRHGQHERRHRHGDDDRREYEGLRQRIGRRLRLRAGHQRLLPPRAHAGRKNDQVRGVRDERHPDDDAYHAALQHQIRAAAGQHGRDEGDDHARTSSSSVMLSAEPVLDAEAAVPGPS